MDDLQAVVGRPAVAQFPSEGAKEKLRDLVVAALQQRFQRGSERFAADFDAPRILSLTVRCGR